MPMPVTTALLVAAAILAGFPFDTTRSVVYVLLGVAVANEALRFVSTRPPGAPEGRQYRIPAIPPAPEAGQPRRERTPISYDDGE